MASFTSSSRRNSRTIVVRPEAWCSQVSARLLGAATRLGCLPTSLSHHWPRMQVRPPLDASVGPHPVADFGLVLEVLGAYVVASAIRA